MPGHKQEHKNWKRSHSDDQIQVLKRGRQVAASFHNHDRLVVVIPVFPDGTLVMGETYRAIMDDISLEFPSSICGAQETPDDVADRLSRIHTHAEVSERIRIGEVYSAPEYLDQIVLLYLAKVTKPKAGKMTPPSGMLSLRGISVQEVSETIAKGGLLDALTSACLMRYLTLNRQGEGLLPTRMRHIEIMDANGEPITTILTNRPEWSFIEFQQENPDLARDWRFKAVDDIASPTGEPIPVKSSLAMRLRRSTATSEPTPKPAFQGQTNVPEQEQEDAPDDVAPSGVFSTARSRPVSSAEHAEERPSQSDKEAAPKPRLSLFSRPMSRNDVDAPVTPSQADCSSSEVTSANEGAKAPEASPEPSVAPAEPVRRRLTLSAPDVDVEPMQERAPAPLPDDARPSTIELAEEVTEAQEIAPDPDADRVYGADQMNSPTAMEAPIAKVPVEHPTGIKAAWGRMEPQLTSRAKALIPEGRGDKTIDKTPKAPSAPKREDKKSVDAVSAGKGGLSKLKGFIKKAIQKDEPEAPEPKQMPTHVLYGVDDAFGDMTPPGPVFTPPAGWGEDK